jgi:hypothetical protein
MPNCFTSLSVYRRLRETGIFYGMWRYVGRPRSIHIARLEDQIFEVFERQPTISTRRTAAHEDTSYPSAHVKLQEQQSYLYHIRSVQVLVPHDTPARRALWLDFAAVDRRTYVYSKGFIHGRIMRHQDWDRWCSRGTRVVTWTSSCDSVSPPATTVVHSFVGFDFKWLPHGPSHFMGTS